MNVKKNANMLEMPLLLFFEKQIFVLENEDIACQGVEVVILMR